MKKNTENKNLKTIDKIELYNKKHAVKNPKGGTKTKTRKQGTEQLKQTLQHV